MDRFRRRAPGGDEQGFTLIELLVVMIIIGILAAVSIPTFLGQKRKAYETAAKSDLKQIVKEVVSYYIDGTGALTLAAGPTTSSWQLSQGATVVATGPLSRGNAVSPVGTITNADSYCVAVVPAASGARTWHADANGLSSGDC